jgi:hypothetical protein
MNNTLNNALNALKAIPWGENLGRAGEQPDCLVQRPSQRRHTLTIDKSGSNTLVSGMTRLPRLEYAQPASVSQFVRRWIVDPKHRRNVEALLSRVKV